MTVESFPAALRDTDMLLPVVASLIAGSLIGGEREINGKPAGLRTHTLVFLHRPSRPLRVCERLNGLSPRQPVTLNVSPDRDRDFGLRKHMTVASAKRSQLSVERLFDAMQSDNLVRRFLIRPVDESPARGLLVGRLARALAMIQTGQPKSCSHRE